jgi:hypothetical protein
LLRPEIDEERVYAQLGRLEGLAWRNAQCIMRRMGAMRGVMWRTMARAVLCALLWAVAMLWWANLVWCIHPNLSSHHVLTRAQRTRVHFCPQHRLLCQLGLN